MNKLKRLSLLFIIIGTLFIAAGAALAYFRPFNPYNDAVSDETLYFGSVRELIVITGSLPITVEYWDGEDCEVSCIGDLPLITDTDESGVLRITQDDSFSLALFTARRGSFGVTVKLPRRTYRRISLTSSSGNVSTQPISCESLEISTRSGDISLFGADERAKIKTESGNIALGISALGGDMELSGGSGDISLTLSKRLSVCMEYMTEKGSCTVRGFSEEFEDRRGDAVILQNGGEYLLKITTETGNLTVNGEQ